MLETAAMMPLYKENMGKLSSALKKADTSGHYSDAYFYGATNFIPALALAIQPTAVRRGAKSLKGSHRMGNGQIFLKTSAPLSLTKAFRMSLISAGSISLDSIFK